MPPSVDPVPSLDRGRKSPTLFERTTRTLPITPSAYQPMIASESADRYTFVNSSPDPADDPGKIYTAAMFG
jgi:hypothetical protein